MSSIIIAERAGNSVTISKEGHGSMTYMIGINSTVQVTPAQIAHLKEATLGNIEAALKKVGLTLVVAEYQNVDAFRESLARQQQFMNPNSQPFFPQQPGMLPGAFQTMNPRFWHGTTQAPKELLNAQFLMGKYSHLVQIITQRVYVYAHLESGVSEQERVHLRAQIDNLNAEETCIRKEIEKATAVEKLKADTSSLSEDKTKKEFYSFGGTNLSVKHGTCNEELLKMLIEQLAISHQDEVNHKRYKNQAIQRQALILKDIEMVKGLIQKEEKTIAEENKALEMLEKATAIINNGGILTSGRNFFALLETFVKEMEAFEENQDKPLQPTDNK